jgi:hypothetical protein
MHHHPVSLLTTSVIERSNPGRPIKAGTPGIVAA